MRIPTFGQFVQQSEYISKEFDKLGKILQQAETGKKLLHSSDDPVLAYQIKSKQDFINTLQGYYDNGVIAQSRVSIMGSAADNAGKIVNQIQVLIKQAQDGTRTDTERLSISKQLEGYLTNLVNIANTQDANGQYIFSGGDSTLPAYVLDSGSYVYQGSGQSSINVAPETSIVYGEDGSSVFGSVFSVLQDTIQLLQAPVTDPAAFLTSINADADSFDQLENHFTLYQSEVGVRAAAINTQVDTNKTVILNQTITLSNLSNVDLPQVYSALAQQSLVLQATQESYLKIQDIFTKLLQMQL